MDTKELYDNYRAAADRTATAYAWLEIKEQQLSIAKHSHAAMAEQEERAYRAYRGALAGIAWYWVESTPYSLCKNHAALRCALPDQSDMATSNPQMICEDCEQ